MKVFEHQVHLKAITVPLLNSLQFADRVNWSVDDSQLDPALHAQHFDTPASYASVLFVDFSSDFNTMVPELLQVKLFQLSVPFQFAGGLIGDSRYGLKKKHQTPGPSVVVVCLSFLFFLNANDSKKVSEKTGGDGGGFQTQHPSIPVSTSMVLWFPLLSHSTYLAPPYPGP